MKKLYRKGTVHPSLPVVSDHLSFLPTSILTLATALSPDDREVLAYLLISSNTISSHVSSHHRKSSFFDASAAATSGRRSCFPSKSEHTPMFSCDCFACYMSYWVRWDSSPNRHLIHEIIDRFEDGLMKSNNRQGSNSKTKKERRKPVRGKADSGLPSSPSQDSKGSSAMEEHSWKDDWGGSVSESAGSGTSDGSTAVASSGEMVEEGAEKGSLRRLVTFIGERIWGVWN